MKCINFSWLKNVHNIINECGQAYIWNTHTLINSDWFISLVKLTLKDLYDQLWHSQMENSSKALACRLFNQHFIPETYLEILDQRSSIILCIFVTIHSAQSIGMLSSNNCHLSEKSNSSQTLGILRNPSAFKFFLCFEQALS